MNQIYYFIAALLGNLLWFAGSADMLYAEKTPISSQPPLRATEEREDYQQCLAAVIRKHSGLPQDVRQKARSDRALTNCRDRYPAVSLLIDCKRDMIQSYRESPEDLKSALQQCRNDYQRISFSPKENIPFAIRERSIFFAGAGLNHSVMLREKDDASSSAGLYMGENFGNFSCTPLLESMFKRRGAEHVLFGTDLHTYTALKHVDKTHLRQAFSWPPPTKDKKPQRLIDQDFGELYLDGTTGLITNYFSTAFCFFNRNLGPKYEAIKIYYLLDHKARQATPYFGIAFFKPQQGPQAKSLASDMQQTLGPNYKVEQTKPEVYVISPSPLTEFDSEQDPKNICHGDKTPPLIGFVHTPVSKDQADYLILANSSNLCQFGNRMASRFLKKGLKNKP